MSHEQVSVPSIPFHPQSADEIAALWDAFIRDPDDEADAFSFEKIRNGYSFFIYGKKAFELADGKLGMFLRLPGNMISEIFPNQTDVDDEKLYKAQILNSDEFQTFIHCLKNTKKTCFRSLISDTFACCNSFVQCSDAGHCLHEKERFYNGCYYRTNLEQGRVFFGKNKNT